MEHTPDENKPATDVTQLQREWEKKKAELEDQIASLTENLEMV